MPIKPYDTESKSRNVLASPLGEEGHEVAKGWTRVRMIMTLDVDVTAEGGIIKLIAREGNPPPFKPFEPSHRRCVQWCLPLPSSRAEVRAGMGADRNRSHDTLSREISRRNVARTIRGGRFLHSASLRSK